MRKRRLAFDQLETRTALCAAFGGVVAGFATGESDSTLPTEQGAASENASQVGGYKSGGLAEFGFANAGEAVQFQLKADGGACNPS
jgi:hypothetical protein